ncbi:MAG TPA: hypothetical protein VFH22_09495, partial [Rhodocyclaceae bacterium]|nr:hypothetical protein [Rhodocyclaceae bacterium]
MPHVFLALVKSLHSFSRPALWRYLVLPPLIAGGVWLLAAVMWLGALIDWLNAETPLAWLAATL